MTSFKEISVEDYKKLLDNRQDTFAKTFKNTELLRNFEKPKNKNTIDNIIKNENQIKKKMSTLKNCLIKFQINYNQNRMN